MMTPTDLWMFVTALAVSYLIPGPDMLLVLNTSLQQGRARALAVASGLALARATHVTLAATGLAALLQTFPPALQLLQLAGGAFLVWIGLQALRASPSAFDPVLADSAGLPPTEAPAAQQLSFPAAWRRGLLTNLLNPKALLFCSVLLPRFLPAAGNHSPGQYLLPGAIVVGCGLLFDSLYSSLSARPGVWLHHHPRARLYQARIFAALLILCGVLLALPRSIPG